jgi:hypothetical protein
MAKKVSIKIINVGTKYGDNYVVGEHGIERIAYEKHGYNKGRQGDFPAYVIFFERSSLRTIIPQDTVKFFVTEVLEEEEQGEIAPELPE